MITVVLREGGERQYEMADRVDTEEHYVTISEPASGTWGRRTVAIFTHDVVSHVLITYPPATP